MDINIEKNILNAKMKILAQMEPIVTAKNDLSGTVEKVAKENNLPFSTLWPWALHEAFADLPPVGTTKPVKAPTKKVERVEFVKESEPTFTPSFQQPKSQIDRIVRTKTVEQQPSKVIRRPVQQTATTTTTTTTSPTPNAAIKTINGVEAKTIKPSKSGRSKPSEIKSLEKKVDLAWERNQFASDDDPLPLVPDLRLTSEELMKQIEFKKMALDQSIKWADRCDFIQMIIDPDVALECYKKGSKWVKVAVTLCSRDNRESGVIGLALRSQDRDLAIAAIKATYDQKKIVWKAREATDKKVRRAAVKKILNEAIRQEVYAKETDDEIKFIIIRMSKDPKWLSQVDDPTNSLFAEKAIKRQLELAR